MAAEAFVNQLNVQIGNEFAAHQQYVACAVYYDQQTMQQTAQLRARPTPRRPTPPGPSQARRDRTRGSR